MVLPELQRLRHLHASFRAFQREYSREFARSALLADLRPVDAMALTLIFDAPSCTPGYVSRYLTLSAGAVTSVVDRLLRLGLVTRERRASDRRSVDLNVTAHGGEVVLRLRRQADEVMRGSMRPEHASAIVEYLDRVRVGLAEATDPV